MKPPPIQEFTSKLHGKAWCCIPFAYRRKIRGQCFVQVYQAGKLRNMPINDLTQDEVESIMSQHRSGQLSRDKPPNVDLRPQPFITMPQGTR